MATFTPTKQHLREVLLHYYILKKKAAETHRVFIDIYGDHAPSSTTCKEWFRRFQSGDYDVSDRGREGAPKKFEDTQLQDLLEEDPSRTLEDISNELNVDRSTVGKRLHALGMVQNSGKWVPRQLKRRHIERCDDLKRRSSRR